MRIRFVAVVSLLMAGFAARAHDPGLSGLVLQVSNSNLRATITLACADVGMIAPLDSDHDGHVTTAEFEGARTNLERVANDALKVSVDGMSAMLSGITAWLEESGEVQFTQCFKLPEGSRLQVQSNLLGSLPRGHRQYALLRDAAGNPLGDKILDVNQPLFEAPLASTVVPIEPTRSLSQFLHLGVEHIAAGYDHLVFLLGLLIIGGDLRSVVKIITAFTVAHSITLALAALDYIRLPASVVEPLIAASIMYVGIENIVRRDLERRWMLAFGFGLIHGCGFASVLRELGLGANGTGVIAPLLCFNLGVELGQMVVAALILPVIWRLNRRESYQLRYVPTCSLSITLAGAYWLAERMLPLLWH